MTTSVEQGHDSSDPIYDSMPPEDPRPEYRDPPRFTLAGAVASPLVPDAAPGGAAGWPLGVFAGHSKKPTYSATATVNVGKSDINTQATPGYLVAAEALASSYSRLVQSQHVAVPAAKKVGESPAQAGSELTAVPISSEPTFTITATGSSPARASALASAAISALRGSSPGPPPRAVGPPSFWPPTARRHRPPCRSRPSCTSCRRMRLHLNPSTATVTTPDTNTVPQTSDHGREGRGADRRSFRPRRSAASTSIWRREAWHPRLTFSSPRRANHDQPHDEHGEVRHRSERSAALVIGLAFAALAGAVDVRRTRRAIA